MLANQDSQTTTKKPWDRLGQIKIPPRITKTLETIEKDATEYIKSHRRSNRSVQHGITSPDELPSIQVVIRQSEPSLVDSLLLGICEDSLPLTLDLTNPAPGSLLIAGDSGSGKTKLLNALLTSAILINPPQALKINLIAHDLLDYTTVSNSSHCHKAITCDHRSAGYMIRETITEVERRRTQPAEAIIILAIDDLARLLKSLNDQEYFQLYRLIKHGPRHRIWTIATLSTRYIEFIDLHLLDAFRTHLLGHIDDVRIAERLGRSNQNHADELQAGNQFCVPTGPDWINFWICHSESYLPGSEQEDHQPAVAKDISSPSE